MSRSLKIYNSLSRQKETFSPICSPYVGMYVCGPTVYSEAHLGNARTFICFDTIYRYLKYLGYKVRYVRNITDVGHLTDDMDDGEDKIGKKAKLENVEPMEIVQRYSNDFHCTMKVLNVLDPDIEPSATGHIIEQIEFVKRLIDKGIAYEVNGSVYFDVEKYNKNQSYGKLSGRVLEELKSGTRDLVGQNEKKNSIDFAVWKRSNKDHIMKWNSPWGDGFPGWHLECSVMSTKYLGSRFDIHGGGMDLKFPHHECEIAQSVACNDEEPAKYWIHANMLTVNGQKMSKSLGNSLLPNNLFSGSHSLLDRAYSPMAVRFFMLQAHYNSTLDISNEALLASVKGYKRLINGLRIAKKLTFIPSDNSIAINQQKTKEILKIIESCHCAMDDDFNTALTIAHLFNLLKIIQQVYNNQLTCEELGEESFNKVKSTYITFVENVLGLKEEKEFNKESYLDIIIRLYAMAKQDKQYDKVDAIRNDLKKTGIVLKDMKNSIDWGYDEQ